MKRDLDRGFSRPYYLLNFIDTTDDEIVAELTERHDFPIPEKGSNITLNSVQYTGSIEEENQESESREEDTIGRFTVEDIDYEYSVVKPPMASEDVEPEEEEEIRPDIMFVRADVKVTPLQE